MNENLTGASPVDQTDRPATEAPRWWHCDSHGDELPRNAWGCPHCVTELRDENARLRKALLPMTEGLCYLGSQQVAAARKALGLPEPVFL